MKNGVPTALRFYVSLCHADDARQCLSVDLRSDGTVALANAAHNTVTVNRSDIDVAAGPDNSTVRSLDLHLYGGIAGFQGEVRVVQGQISGADPGITGHGDGAGDLLLSAGCGDNDSAAGNTGDSTVRNRRDIFVGAGPNDLTAAAGGGDTCGFAGGDGDCALAESEGLDHDFAAVIGNSCLS